MLQTLGIAEVERLCLLTRNRASLPFFGLYRTTLGIPLPLSLPRQL